MANLSDHDLKQMDEAWQGCQAEPVVRGLLKRALDDLRLARDRLNQTPGNSSRPSGSMPPWQRRAIAEAASLALDQVGTVDAGDGQGPAEPSAVVGANPEQQQQPSAPTATAQPEAPVPKPASGAQVVTARRVSYGTRTAVGSHSVALLASIIDTCRLRRASATDLLARAIHAARTQFAVHSASPSRACSPNSGCRGLNDYGRRYRCTCSRTPDWRQLDGTGG